LADETNKALAACAANSDWCFYIQGDEVIHEKYLPVIKKAMEQNLADKNVEALLFNYKHFYGSYDFLGDARRWYRKEIRIVRNDKQISSYRDAQGFRKNDQKLNVKQINAFVYHYGWVKTPEAQQAKQQSFHKMWHDDNWVKENVAPITAFDYSNIDSLSHFTETHPKVMEQRIKRMNWKFSFDPTQKKLTIKHKMLMFIEKRYNWKIGEYKNYKII